MGWLLLITILFMCHVLKAAAQILNRRGATSHIWDATLLLYLDLYKSLNLLEFVLITRQLQMLILQPECVQIFSEMKNVGIKNLCIWALKSSHLILGLSSGFQSNIFSFVPITRSDMLTCELHSCRWVDFLTFGQNRVFCFPYLC